MKPREFFSGVLTVYTMNVTELIQRGLLCSYAYAKPLLLYGLEAVNPNERTLTRIITA